MDMIASRNQTSHTCNRATAQAIVEAVIERYQPQFVLLDQRLAGLEAAGQ